MPEPIKEDAGAGAGDGAGAGGEGAGEPKVDMFGQGEPPAPPEKKTESEKKFENIPDDHPTIVGLKNQIEAVKKEYGGNLSGQRDVIKTLEGKIELLTKGKGGKGETEPEGDVLFKKDQIKWSKDLKAEEREDMTETEIKQMDEIAAMKEAQNKLYASQQKSIKESGAAKVEDLNSLVRATALELSKGENGVENPTLANQIIESSKQFNFEGLDEKTAKERIASAAKLIPDYKAPKENPTKTGKVVADGKGGGTDPFASNDKIVAEATTPKGGNYAL